MERIAIGFGSNLGDSVRICREAVDALGRHPQIAVERVSSFYRTEPVGMVDQDWFINGVALCATSLKPLNLLEVTSRIEEEFGRVRQILWGPRSLDLDILYYGDSHVDHPRLQIPHLRMHERSFVLIPLAEIAPRWVHPLLGMTPQEMLAELATTSCATEVQRLDTT